MLFDDNQMLENILESDGCRTCFRIDNDLSNKSSAHYLLLLLNQINTNNKLSNYDHSNRIATIIQI